MAYVPLFRRRVREIALLAETTNGTFNAPNSTGTDSVILPINPTLTWAFESNDRNVVTTDLSTFPAVVGKTAMELSFDVELRRTGATTSETSDQWMRIVRACGLVITNPSSNIVIKPTSKSSDEVTLSAYVYLGSSGSTSYRVSLRGLAGDLSADHENGKPSILHVKLMGVFQAVSSAGTVNTVTQQSTVPTAFLAPTFTFNAVASRISKFAWALNNEVVQREDVNSTGGILHYAVVGRKPTFSFNPEVALTGTQDFHTLMSAGTQCAVAFNIQSSTLTFAAAAAQITSIADGDRNGIAVFDCSGNLNRSTGDDEITITAA